MQNQSSCNPQPSGLSPMQERRGIRLNKKQFRMPGYCLGFVLLGIWAIAQGGDTVAKAPKDAVAHGKYIVEDVAMCSQCHTPHDRAGNPDRAQWLQGAPVWLMPTMPISDWPLKAPRIAGLVPGSDADMVKLLTTGIWRDGQRLRPPMPQFRMSREDAEAVVAYLKSLSGQTQQ